MVWGSGYDGAFVHAESPSYFRRFVGAEPVRIVLDPRGDPDGMEGGHFSRLWSSSAWQEQPPWPCAGSDESSGEADASGVDTERSAEERSAHAQLEAAFQQCRRVLQDDRGRAGAQLEQRYAFAGCRWARAVCCCWIGGSVCCWIGGSVCC